MSAATVQPCIVCHASSSKYKCPACRSATCSLVCSKQHTAQGHSPSALSSSSDAHSAGSSSQYPLSTSNLLPSLHLREEIIEAPNANRFSKIDKYVGLNQYDSAQLMEDFEYLQYLGKCVTLLGKDISKNGWLKDESQKPNSSQQQQQSGSHGRGAQNDRTSKSFYHQHVSAEVKNRQTFESWIRKLRLPIMLIPDGMSLRKENQTRWKNNTKQLLCTVEVRFPSVTSSPKTRILIHHIPWDRQTSDVVLKEMIRKARQKSNVASNSPTDEAGVVSMCEKVSLDIWDDSLCIAVSVSQDRLRNESSSKFLEWWQRQVKNGMVKADGLEFDEVKKGELEQLRNGAWAAFEGMESAVTWPVVEGNKEESKNDATEEQDSGSGLISSLLLGKMQAAHAIKTQMNADSVTPVNNGSNSKSSSSVSSNLSKRSLVVLEGKETFQSLLQSLPKGLAIVEYFRLEVWPKKALLEQIQIGNIVRKRLEGSADGDSDLQINSEKRDRDDVGGMQVVEAKRIKTVNDSKNALGSLTAYASSDEEEEEEDQDQDSDQEEEEGVEGEGEALNSRYSDDITNTKPILAGGLAEMARSLGMVPL